MKPTEKQELYDKLYRAISKGSLAQEEINDITNRLYSPAYVTQRR